MGVSTPIDHRGSAQVVASPATGTFTVSGTANFLLVTLNFDQAAGMAVTAVTYNGVAMVACGSIDTNATQNPYSAAFYMYNPPTGSSLTISITISGTITDIYWDATTYSGVNGTTPIRAGTYQAPTNPTTTAGGTYALTVSSNTNDRTITVINSPGGTSGSDQSGGGTYVNTAGAYSGSMDYCTTPAASIVHTWSALAVSSPISIIGFSLNGDPTTTAVVTTPPLFLPVVRGIRPAMAMIMRQLLVNQIATLTTPVVSAPDGLVSYEELATTSQTQPVVDESLGSVSQTQQVIDESLSSVSQTQQVALETLGSVAQTQSVVLEALAGLTVVVQVVLEALGSVAQAQLVADESLGSVSQSQLVNYVSQGNVSQSQLTNDESLGSITQIQLAVDESLGSVSQSQQVADESLGSVTQALVVAFEALGSVAQAIAVAYEVLSGVSQSQLVNYEAAGIATSPVSNSITVALEVLQGINTSGIISDEAIAAIIVAQTVALEVVGSITALQLTATESLGSLSASTTARLEVLASALAGLLVALEAGGLTLVILARVQARTRGAQEIAQDRPRLGGGDVSTR